MDQRLLKQCISLADCLHFGRASRACHVSPSALSRNIQSVEAAVGVELFKRTNRNVALTPAGERFVRYARAAVAEWDDLRAELQSTADEVQGELSLYCSVTASYSFLFRLLTNFRHDYPGVEIRLHTGDPEDAIERVLEGLEDVAIGARPKRLSQRLQFKSIVKSPLRFIVGKQSTALVNRLSGSVNQQHGLQAPMILPERGVARQQIDDWFKSSGIQPNVYAQVAGNEAIASMVSLGFGVGVVPEIVLENSPLARQVRVLNVKPKLGDYDVGLFTLEKKLDNPVVDALWGQRS